MKKKATKNELIKNVIINGNSIDEMNKMPENSVDLIFADPPYWMRTEGVLHRVEGTAFDGCDDDWDKFNSLDDYEVFTEAWLRACYRILKPNGSFWVIGGMQCIYAIGAVMQKLGFWFINDVIWYKKNPTPNFMGTRLNNSHETLIWATKKKNSKYTFNYKTAKELNLETVSRTDHQKGVRKQLGSVWRMSVCSGNERLKNDAGEKLHSTQKPEELLYRIIAISSKPGDLVLDPFGGTMTTAAMAKRLGRDYIMLERDENYCKCGQKRIDAVEYEDSDIANAVFDKKPLKVSMTDMIANGFFEIGEDFYLKDAIVPSAKLVEEGKLLFDGKIVDMHSCAAVAKGSSAKRLNGFDCWYVMRNGELKSISVVRDEFRDMLSNNQ